MQFRLTITSFFVLTGSLSQMIAQTLQPGHILHHHPDEQHESLLTLSSHWDSKYISEGRNNLHEGGIGSLSLEWNNHFEIGELLLAAWYAEGTSTNYSELNLGIAYLMPLDPFHLKFGYTWLDFSVDNTSDHEISLEVGNHSFDFFELNAAIVYSADTGGTFLELVASKEIEKII
ncbi:MAG: hypothetical protein O3C43_18660 [Verrucomicrobia bacterium]|nr:hypothetical protein [Verrucomicrobiota bacterium]MDA1068513.1 hypothetical protein [Verrucomicrobiota bacterium]